MEDGRGVERDFQGRLEDLGLRGEGGAGAGEAVEEEDSGVRGGGLEQPAPEGGDKCHCEGMELMKVRRK